MAADPAGNDARRQREAELLPRAKAIFLEVVELAMVERDSAIDRACAGDTELKPLVLSLLKGDVAPLALESLADDIRAAADAIGTLGSAPLGERGSAAGPGDGRDRIGDYRLLERLGEGGFGVVFAAQQEKPVLRRVALKILKLGMDTKQVVARFEAERQALAMMDHPGIARVFDAGATPTGRPYFVMELVKGLPITEYCDQKKLSIRERLALIAEVCEALQHAHTKGVIHRDIKPSNILVSTIGDKPAPKIIDFGVAKATSARLTEKTIFTEFRQMIGTPEYMSPEQAGDSGEDVDTRTDVYAVGVLLYELLTGATPFDSARLRSAAYGEMQRIIREEDPPKPSTWLSTHAATIGAVATQRATEPSRLTRAVKGELDWIVMKALEKDRARRYDSAAAMAADLQRFLSGHAVLAAPPSAAYRARKFIRRNRGAVIAGSLLLAALLAGLVGTSVGLFRADRQRAIAVSERERADENAMQARAAESIATRRAYTANMMSASAAINGVQYSAARAFLGAVPERLRGWEWRVLNARLDTSIRTLAMAGAPRDWYSSKLLVHPDGRSFFSLDMRGETAARRWDLETGRLLQAFPSPDRLLNNENSEAHIAGGGHRLTITSNRRTDTSSGIAVDSWDLSTGARAMRREFAGAAYLAHRSMPSVDGDRLFIYIQDRVRCVPLATAAEAGSEAGDILAEQPLSAVTRPLAVSHGGTMIAEGIEVPPFQLALRDAHTLMPIAMLETTNLLNHACFSTDDRWLGVTSQSDTARVWDLSASPPTSMALSHPCTATNICFSPDAALVATIAIDRAIRIWDRASGRLLGMYASESLDPTSLMFLLDGRTVAGWETGGAVRFWDVTALDAAVLRGHRSIVSKARIASGNPAGIIVSCSWEGADGSTGIVRLWDADSGDTVGVHHGKMGDIAHAMAISDDGEFAAIGIVNMFEQNRVTLQESKPRGEPIGRIEILDLSTGDVVLAAPTARQTRWIAFAGDNRSVIVADSPASTESSVQLRLLDPHTGTEVRTKDLDPKPSWAFARSPDGRTLAALPVSPEYGANRADRPGTMLLLDTQSLETIREVDGIPEGQHSISFSHDGARIATGSVDGILGIFDAENGRPLASLAGQSMRIFAIAFSPDGTRIASAGLDRKVSIWDARTYEQVGAFGGHEGHIGTLDWDASGERLVSGSGDHTVRIWEPTPIRARIEARAARRAALAIVEPMVAKLFEELKDPARVVEHLRADPSLDALQRTVALQTVLKKSLDSAPETPPSEKSRASAGDDFAT